ncbi:hypothetical protein [Serinicoccus chungangensis]|uniref:hypothetical protein n=1 Tax=Serinicoccus chungangensis TaxID=767452 RepID=UPI00111888F1|nr:hypothetical protein [Serinicoccus chungangensis]
MSIGRGPAATAWALAGAGTLAVLGGVLLWLSTPRSFGWFAYQEIEPSFPVQWQEIVGPIAICLGATLLTVGSYLLGRQRSRRS